MADGSVAITAGTGTPIRVLTGLGASSADQQVVTLADSAGNLLGTAAAPLPVTGSGTAGTPASGVQTVQGITGGTAVPVSALALPIGTTRTAVALLVDGIAAVATEALVSYSGQRGGSALTTGTGAYVVTTGKTFRLQSLAVWGTGTAIDRVRVRVRALLTTVVAASPIYLGTAVAFGASAGATSELNPDGGVEIPAGFQIGISVIGATTSTFGVNITGFEY